MNARKKQPAAGPTTVTEVAKLAGVSVSTVSRILNGSARVADDKREAVEKAIEELNFKPNLLAQSLKRGSSMTIGVLVQAVESPFFNETLRGIEDTLSGTGYAALIVSGHWNASEEAERIRLLIARRADGLILLSGHLDDEEVLAFSEHLPIVAAGRQLEAPRAASLRLDNVEGGLLATRHLLSLGHTRIAHISGPADHIDAIERLSGYRMALEEAGLAFDPGLVVQGDFRETGGLLAVNQLLARGLPFSALFAANDQTAFGARLALYRKGIRVPEDISLIGYDDLPGSSFTTPPLTTIRQPVYEMGRQAAIALLALIGGQDAALELPRLELVIRETTQRMR